MHTAPYSITPREGGHFDQNGFWNFTRFNVAYIRGGRPVWVHFCGGLSQACAFDNEMVWRLRKEPFSPELVDNVGKMVERLR